MIVRDYSHEIDVQRRMIADMQKLGWDFPCHRTCCTGRRIACTLGELFDIYSLHLWICQEKNV